MLDIALEAARAGAEVLRRTGLGHGSAELKQLSGDYVTGADHASEDAIVEVLLRRAPGIPILAEERGGAPAGTRWAVDPLDGTTNFTRAVPVVGVSVALLEGGNPEVGVVIGPWLDIEFAVQRGLGATLNGKRLPPLGRGNPTTAVVATGFPFRRKDRVGRYMPVLHGALSRFEDLRRAGAASLDLAWTACGTFDGFFELGLGTWDVAAGAALVLELGGRVSDWSGGDGWLETGDILAAPAAVHEVLLELAADGASER
ncbi:MAG TPA: inositol monophosphatase family protein [Candidatus Dormibacteraeota bacterium]|nr:inositol monophosphatase family protein [Candidatus Dormibacteraeota bacterium]